MSKLVTSYLREPETPWSRNFESVNPYFGLGYWEIPGVRKLLLGLVVTGIVSLLIFGVFGIGFAFSFPNWKIDSSCAASLPMDVWVLSICRPMVSSFILIISIMST
jgi:hypothetical protein